MCSVKKLLRKLRKLEKQVAGGEKVHKAKVDYYQRQLLNAYKRDEINARQQENRGMSEED